VEGASRQSLAAVRRRLDDMLREPVAAGSTDARLIQRGLARLRAATGTGPDPAQLAAELFAVADLLQAEAGLRRALADPGTAQRARIGLLEQVLSGKVSDDALEVLRWAVESRWSRDRDLESAIDTLGVEAELASAEAQGQLEDVEDELFRFGRIAESNAELSLALSDLSVPAARKRGLLERLLEGRANAVTIRLVQRAVTRGEKGRTIDRVIDDLVALAAERRQRKVAVVQVARPLDAGQTDRLREALSRTFGGEVELRVDVVPDVLGGIIVQVGDEVVDGSVARRLAEAQRLLGR
jgi:F-type H+-transporting ATPase subunit delta